MRKEFVPNATRLHAIPFLLGLAAWYAMLPTMIEAQASSRTPRAQAASVLPLESNGSPLELAALAGIRVTKSGAVLFADSKPVTLRIRESRGGGIRQVARAGAGPGEYRSAPEFIGYRADSIVAYDDALSRWSVLSPTGEFVRVLATGREGAPLAKRAAWVANGALVFNASLEDVNAPLTPVLRRVVLDATKGDQPLIVRQASNGDLWTATALASTTWTVYDRAGRRRNIYRFPAPFRLAYVNDTVAVGQALDADELPQIVRMPLGLAVSVAKARANPNVNAEVDAAVSPEQLIASRTLLTNLLRGLVGQQEMAYADSSRYASSISALRLKLPSEVQLNILYATNRGWFAFATHTSSGVSCAMGVGSSVMMGWSEAVPYCSQ